MCCLYLSQNTLKFLLWLLPLTRWLLKSAFVSAYFWIFQFCFCCGFLVSFCCGWKDPFYDFNILKFLKTSFVASIWFILEDFPYALGKKKKEYFAGIGWSVPNMPVTSRGFTGPSRAWTSLPTFRLLSPSLTESGAAASSAATAELPPSPCCPAHVRLLPFGLPCLVHVCL